jgi:8-oxo-dGTP pyrophosphatase MutT (NUDIX family)
MMIMAITPTEEIKELLLNELKYFIQFLQQNEKSGESRVNIFVTILTALPIAFASLLLKKDTTLFENKTAIPLFFIALFTAIVYGFFTLNRLIKRNRTTDDAKYKIAKILQIYKELFGKGLVIDDNLEIKDLKLRGVGSLPHFICLLNSFAISILVFVILLDKNVNQYLVSTGVALVCFIVQEAIIIKSERKSKTKINEKKFTHAGGVVYKIDNENKLLFLIASSKHDKNKETKINYILPKGHNEKGEGLMWTAVREVYEETGCIASIKQLIGGTTSKKNTQKKIKNIRFYLMEFLAQEISSEKREILWLPFEEAYKKLSYDDAKVILKDGYLMVRQMQLEKTT